MSERERDDVLLDMIFAHGQQQGLFDEIRPMKTAASADDRALFDAWERSTTIGELERGWSTLVANDLIDYRLPEPLWRSEFGEEPRIFYVRRWRELREDRSLTRSVYTR